MIIGVMAISITILLFIAHKPPERMQCSLSTQNRTHKAPPRAGATVAYILGIGPINQGAEGISIGIHSTADGGIRYDSEDPYDPDTGGCNSSEWTGTAPVAASADCPNPTPSLFPVFTHTANVCKTSCKSAL